MDLLPLLKKFYRMKNQKSKNPLISIIVLKSYCWIFVYYCRTVFKCENKNKDAFQKMYEIKNVAFIPIGKLHRKDTNELNHPWSFICRGAKNRREKIQFILKNIDIPFVYRKRLASVLRFLKKITEKEINIYFKTVSYNNFPQSLKKI